MKYGQVTLTAMVYTFKCDNKKCGKSLICLLSKYNGDEYFERCNYCGSGRLKWIENMNLHGILRDHKIIHRRQNDEKDKKEDTKET